MEFENFMFGLKNLFKRRSLLKMFGLLQQPLRGIIQRLPDAHKSLLYELTS